MIIIIIMFMFILLPLKLYQKFLKFHSKGSIAMLCKRGKVKQSGNRPGVAQSVPGGLDSQISLTFGT